MDAPPPLFFSLIFQGLCMWLKWLRTAWKAFLKQLLKSYHLVWFKPPWNISFYSFQKHILLHVIKHNMLAHYWLWLVFIPISSKGLYSLSSQVCWLVITTQPNFPGKTLLTSNLFIQISFSNGNFNSLKDISSCYLRPCGSLVHTALCI